MYYEKNESKCGDYMKKFQIPITPPTTSKSIRFPNDIIDQVESMIVGKDCTFTAFVVEAVRIALEDIDNEQAIKNRCVYGR